MLWTLGLTVAMAGDPAAVLPTALEETRSWRALRRAEGLPALPGDVYDKVAKGRIEVGLEAVEGHAAKKSWGVGIVQAPIDRLWAAINDERMHPRHTQLEYAELVKGSFCKDGRHVFQYLDVGVPMVQDRWWITVRTTNQPLHQASEGRMRELVWRSTTDTSLVTSEAGRAKVAEGIPVEFTRGSWFLISLDEQHTLIEYYTWVDPGGSLSPTLMSWFAGKSIRGAFESMVAASKDPSLGCLDPSG